MAAGSGQAPMAAASAARSPPPSADAVVASTIAGAGPALPLLREALLWPQMHAAEAGWLGVRWPRGVLLHGPPGCGKSSLVAAVAREAGAVMHVLTAGDVFGAYAGESERRLRDAFAAAAADAASGKPAVLVLEDADALCPRRDGRHQHEARVVAQLLTLMDGAGAGGARPLVVAVSSRPGALDPALRRPGRLDREIAVPPPDAEQRQAILALYARHLPLSADVDLVALARAAVGYSGADLSALCREAALGAIAAQAAQPEGPALVAAERHSMGTALAIASVTPAHFVAAMARVGASLVRGAAAEPGPVSWADIGGLAEVKRRLRQAVEWPLKHAAAFERLGLRAARGVLLHGPPGCSKTTLARAAAAAAGATLLSLSGAELFSMYVGEGEATLRATFARARLASPAIILLDEVETLGRRRALGGGGPAGGGELAAERLLSTLLTELDGLVGAGSGVLVLAATNCPAALDAALLRPGRLELQLYVPPPDAAGRAEALRVHTRGAALAADVDLDSLATDCERFTGAELEALCRDAALAALREGAEAIAAHHFAAARAAAVPGLSAAQLAAYAAFGRSREAAAAQARGRFEV